MNNTLTLLCVAGVSGLAMLTPAAAYAATDDGAQADANALTATILGQSGDTGQVKASNDGTGEKKTNDTVNPPVDVLSGQPYAGIGVLAQDATAANNGRSAACSGVAGDGGVANVIEIGDTNCLTPGDNINLQLANLELDTLLDAEVVRGTGTSLDTLLDALGALPGGADAVQQVTDGLQAAVDQVQANLGNAGLVLDVGAVEASCRFDGQSSGRTVLANGDVRLVIPQVGDVPLTQGFDPEPAPNTHVIAQSDQIVALILDDLRAALNDQLDQITDPVFANLIDPVQDQVVAQVVAQLQPALQAVQDNLLDITLNKQTRTGRSIDVTGLSVEVLPGAQQFGAPVVVDLNIANVGCGPAARAVVAPTPTPNGPQGGDRPDVPTAVDAGTEGGGHGGLIGLVAAGLAALGLGTARARRVARR
jgi:hypothetical protein